MFFFYFSFRNNKNNKMAAKFPNNDDKDNGVSWIKHPNKLLNKNKNKYVQIKQQEKESLVGKEKESVADKEKESFAGKEKESVAGKEKESLAVKENESLADKEKESLAGKEKESLAVKEKESLADKEKESLEGKENESVADKEKESLAGKEKDTVVKTKKNKRKKANNVENTNINLPSESSSDSDEMKCLEIFETLVSKFKTGDTAFIKLVDDLCNIYNCKNTQAQKLKIDLIEKLLLNLVRADEEELQTIKKEINQMFIDKSVKKLFVDDEDIIILGFQVDEFLGGCLTKDDVFREVYVMTGLAIPLVTNLIRNEAMILSKLDHPNIYNMLAVTRNFNKMAFEIDDHTNLKRLLLDKEISSNPKRVTDMLIKIAETMAYIHSQDILYNNLTSNSIRINKNENVKIYRFGSAAYVGDSNGEYYIDKECLNSSYHISPETAKTGIFTTKTDVWAMGMLCFEVFHYLSKSIILVPLEIDMLYILMDFQQGLRKLKRPSKCPIPLFSYITEKLLNLDPDRRPNFMEIVTTLQEIRRRY